MLSEREIIRLMAEAALGPESRLSAEKVFTAADVVVNVGPAPVRPAARASWHEPSQPGPGRSPTAVPLLG